MDFTQPKHNSFFTQALTSHVDDPTSIVGVLSTRNVGQWQVALDAKYQSLVATLLWPSVGVTPNTWKK
jgi:hypothetical protein